MLYSATPALIIEAIILRIYAAPDKIIEAKFFK